MKTTMGSSWGFLTMSCLMAVSLMMGCPDGDSGDDAGTDAGLAQDSDGGGLSDAGNLTDAGHDSDAGSGNGGNGPVTNPIGGCVLSTMTGAVPSNLYENTGIVQSTDYAPFTKVLTVRGITLMGRADNEDAFMNNWAVMLSHLTAGSTSPV